MHQDAWTYLAVKIQGQLYANTHLPLGLAPACRIHTVIMGEVYRPLRLHGQLRDEDRYSACLYSGCKVLYIAMRQCCQLDSLGNLHLHLLQATGILVPALQYVCQIWGMHSPRAAVANDARAALQRLYDYYLRTIYRLLPSTPRRLLLTELGLLPLHWFPLPHCLFGQPYRCFSGGCMQYG